MTQDYHSFDGKELSKITDINLFLDDSGVTKSDLFNNKGALLVLKGKIPPDKIFKMPVYTYIDSINKHVSYLNNDVISDQENPFPREDKDRLALVEEKRKEAVKIYGSNTLDIYDSGMNMIKDLFKIDTTSFAKAEDIVNETYKKDRIAVHSCIHSLRFSDTYTYNHSFSVYLLFTQALEDFRVYNNSKQFFDVFKEMCRNINFNTQSIKKYGLGSLLHDYGKILIPDEILNKPGKLTKEEFEVMKSHPGLGVNQLKKLDIDDQQILELVGNHHPEYPVFPKNVRNPLAMICNIIDIYDACRSDRCYRKGCSYEKTKEILESNRVKLGWDPFIYMVVTRQTIPKFEEKME
ncbi:MAG: HD domain-containing protein [Spirochaetes bacterium]|nr:HD domain-containing protein [Spirochaetota bacterium]